MQIIIGTLESSTFEEHDRGSKNCVGEVVLRMLSGCFFLGLFLRTSQILHQLLKDEGRRNSVQHNCEPYLLSKSSWRGGGIFSAYIGGVVHINWKSDGIGLTTYPQ